MGKDLREIRKKLFVTVIVLITCFVAVGCGASTTDSSDNDSSSNSNQSQSETQGATLEDTIRQNAAKALYDRLVDLYGSRYDVSATKYSIATIEETSPGSGYGYTVRGKFYMYDKYGDAVSDYYPGTFLVFTDENGNVGSDYNSVRIN